MANWTILSILCLIVSSSHGDYTYIGTEESLRQNIADLFQGKLKFSDEAIPSYEDELPDTTPENSSEYDFIVIGAGSAGATIASRLSEVKQATVLLIEAGIKEYPIMDIPLMAVPLQLSNQINWGYQTESSDKYCLGLTNSKCNWPRAKVMGGNSVMNFMVATRGNRRDYDGWATASGDKTWSYEHMLKYLKKLENFQVDDVEVDEKFHNRDGPLSITSPLFHTKLGEAFIEANKELGLPQVDYNSGEQKGVSYFQQTIVNGERCSTNRAYLHPAKNRKNLFLTRNSHVNKILIHEFTKTAYGVQFTKDNKNILVKAKKEIILSAGAINSPQILMLSGIGPAKHLREFGINVLKDAPVGENLMDHLAYGGMTFKVNDSQTFSNLGLLDPANPMIRSYIKERNGSLAMGSGFEALSYIKITGDEFLSDNSDIELLFGSTLGIKDPVLSQVLGVSDFYRDKLIADPPNHSSFTVWPMIMHPKSRGKILLRSKDPNDKPKLYANYLDHPDDIRIVIKGIRAIIKLSKTKAFQQYGAELYDIPLPCDKHEYDSDAYWECATRTFTFTTYHQSGTCKMGRKSDKTAVVDSKLKVIGIQGLRVADASIMPKIVSAHPHIPIVAIGEKISDEIKRYWGYIE